MKRRRKDDEATDQRGRSARGSERARERAADGWGWLVSESERAGEGEGEGEGEGAGEGAGEGGP